MARPRLLTDAVIEEIALDIELGGSLGGAARRAGCSARSLRRWLSQGRSEVDALSPEAKLVLRLGRPEQRPWENIAAQLATDHPERWGELSAPRALDEVLADLYGD